MRKHKWSIAVGALALLVVFFVFRGRAPEAHPEESQRDAPFLDGNLIRFSDAFAKRAGVNAVAAGARDLEPLISVTGTVTYDARQFAAVGARIQGRVRKIFKLEGDLVAAHTVLAEVESAELGRTEALLLAARAKEIAAEADMKRESELSKSHISSEREAEMANAHFAAARAERIAAEQAVKALGGEMTGEIGILLIRSPIAGHVVAAKVARGQTVEPTDTVYEVADLTSVWVELKVFERDLLSIRVGDAVEISPPFKLDAPVTGKVAYVGQVIDPTTRSARVRVVIDNQKKLLKPGQSVTARIHTAAPPGKMLVVPRAAVTRIDGKPTVFVLLDHAVEPRPVELGPNDHDSVGILSGIEAGSQVVVGGLLELKSEIFR